MSLTENLNYDEFSRVQKALEDIAKSVQHPERVTGRTHQHYKYPAGFSPDFPRAVMRAFSRPGDWIIDPFMGGGTTILEANSIFRNAIGIDLNELAIFSAKLKTITMNTSAISEVELWGDRLLRMVQKKQSFADIPEEFANYFEILPERLSRFLYSATQSIARLGMETSRIFAKGVLLRVAQLILDNRDFRPSLREFTMRFEVTLDSMIEQTVEHTKELQNRLSEQQVAAPINVLIQGDSTEEATIRRAIAHAKVSPSLVITSPPYPGVHVLYNRWQVGGRKESSLPYFIIGSQQMESNSYFTMGYRKSEKGLKQYFHSIWSVYTNLFDVLNRGTPVIQLVAFNDKKNQMEPFLQAMSDSGFVESKAYNIERSEDGRIWRSVPNRKWYNQFSKNSSHSSHEVVLIHMRR